MDTKQKTVSSKDGTSIAFELAGAGPVIVLVGAALADRAGTAKLAKALAEKFTVINYDRRGRGKSTDTQPFAIEREVEDIEALIDDAGGSAYLFGNSSGAVLALEAASKLGDKVNGLFMYEPPFIVDDGHPPMPEDFAGQTEKLLAAGRRNDAVKLFFHKGMGIPAFAVMLMRLFMPGWSKMVAMAHTIPYDLAILADTQTGRPLPAGRWASVRVPALVMVGSKSEAFFHTGAKALASLHPGVQYHSLDGGHHGSVMTAPGAIAAALDDFIAASNDGRDNPLRNAIT